MTYPRQSISFYAILSGGAISTDYDADPWFEGGDIPDEFTSAFAAHSWLATNYKGRDTDGADLEWEIWDNQEPLLHFKSANHRAPA